MCKNEGIALGMFCKKRTKPCKGETHAVKFWAQVLGQKATHLVRPYRACHCFTTQTQGDALGFHRTPRWGWEGRVRHAAFCPVGAGEAWFVMRPLSVGAGEGGFIGRRLPFGLEACHTGGTISELTRGCGRWLSDWAAVLSVAILSR